MPAPRDQYPTPDSSRSRPDSGRPDRSSAPRHNGRQPNPQRDRQYGERDYRERDAAPSSYPERSGGTRPAARRQGARSQNAGQLGSSSRRYDQEDRYDEYDGRAEREDRYPASGRSRHEPPRGASGRSSHPDEAHDDYRRSQGATQRMSPGSADSTRDAEESRRAPSRGPQNNRTAPYPSDQRLRGGNDWDDRDDRDSWDDRDGWGDEGAQNSWDDWGDKKSRDGRNQRTGQGDWKSRSLGWITAQRDDTKKSDQSTSRWRALLRSRKVRITAIVLLLVVILSGAIGGIDGYIAYTHARASAEAGMTQLKSAQTLLDPYLKHPTLPDSTTLTTLNSELAAAHTDFAAARSDMTHSSILLASPIPLVHSAFALLTAADEMCQAGLDLTNGLAPVITVAQGGFFATKGNSQPSTPQLTPAMLSTLTSDYESALGHINTAVANIRTADLASLPTQFVSAKQVAEIQSTLANWGATQAKLNQVDQWLHLAPTLLGMSQPEKLFVEVMDRAEMRATGGFIGAYAIMSISNGKIQPFSLQDIFTLDTPYLKNIGVSNSKVPAAYSWWPFPGFGIRDSNLSPDFPTSAKLGLDMLAKEGGPSVQGLIAINEPVIADLIKITGPITVPVAAYGNVTVTASNLEAMIRTYTETSAQVDPDLLPTNAQLTDKHENFTALLGQQLMNKIHNLHGSENAKLIQIMLSSIPTKDMQVYFSDQQTETLISGMGASGAIPTGPGDAVTIADDNVTGNKASGFTKITYTDNITLDTKGDATHHLTITYHFAAGNDPSMIHFLYGKDFYHTYLRVYAPAAAQIATSKNAFSQEMNRGWIQYNHTDFPGRQMWGGLIDINDSIAYNVNLVWTVPAIVTPGSHGQASYTLDFQHQSGSNQQLVLTITTPGSKTPSVKYTGPLDKDEVFTLTY